MPTDPLISVVMPVYNAARYLRESVGSILSQTCGDFELLMVDDGSTDGSKALMEELARRDPRVRTFFSEHGGLLARINQGISNARGRFIARMDADDICTPDRFEKQLAFLEANPDCVAVGSCFVMIDPDGEVLARGERPLEHEGIDAWHMEGRGGAIMHPAVMFRADGLRAVGGYSDRFRVACEDLDLFLRLAEHGRLANLPEALIFYRLHVTSFSYQKSAEQYKWSQVALADACNRRRCASPQFTLERAGVRGDVGGSHQHWAELAANAGNWNAAFKHGWLAAKAEPFSSRRWGFLRTLLANASSKVVAVDRRGRWPTRCFAIAWASVLNRGAQCNAALRRVLARTPVLWRLAARGRAVDRPC